MSSLPCVGCGWCCLSDPCVESHILYGYQKRCPDIYWDEPSGRYRCRLAEDPIKGERMRFLLGIGHGCCAPLNGWRDDVRDREKE
ncbi:MAG TPA: hypothetical protein PKD41_03570 [Solidesulfovibrio sp.]|nr:hypothetical protein [Desulfovibrio sp.]HML59940.1 hypothetical protein [Solidesulfovibrio sp.]